MCQYANKKKKLTFRPPVDTFFIGILAHWHISILINYLYYDKD